MPAWLHLDACRHRLARVSIHPQPAAIPTLDRAEESEGEESEGEESVQSEAEGNADGAANGQQEVGQVEGGGESISIKQAIKKKLISAEYLEAWWRSSLWWRGRG